MQLFIIEQIIEYLLAMLQPYLGTDESLYIDFRIQSGCSNGARIQLDVRLNEISAEVAPTTTIEQL